jgi:glycosyltransferase involved in cell wall biosynthesis
MAPFVSVIIPTYNSERTLRLCLEAVLDQTRPPDEVLVVDDGSRDRTLQIAAEFVVRADQRHCSVRLLPAPVNQGPAAARNRGIRASRGEVLFFVDSDCAPEPDAIEKALAILRDAPDVACVHGIYRVEPLIDDGPVEAYRLLHAHHWRLRHAGRVRTAIFALCAIRRAVFEEVGLFDENLRASEDVELSDRMADRFGIVLSPAVTCRHDDDSELGPLLRKQFARSQLLVPVAVHERGPAGIRANRPLGVLAAGLTVALLPAAFLSPVLIILPVMGLVMFAAADPSLARFVVRQRGPAFLIFFLAVHFLVHLAVVAGALVGALRWLVDRDFGPSHRHGEVLP